MNNPRAYRYCEVDFLKINRPITVKSWQAALYLYGLADKSVGNLIYDPISIKNVRTEIKRDLQFYIRDELGFIIPTLCGRRKFPENEPVRILLPTEPEIGEEISQQFEIIPDKSIIPEVFHCTDGHPKCGYRTRKYANMQRHSTICMEWNTQKVLTEHKVFYCFMRINC